MGIDISAKVIYGVMKKDVNEDLWDILIEHTEDEGLDYASPYYDSPPSSGLLA